MFDPVCNLTGAAFLFLLGLALGSFLELATDRLSRGESLLWPPARCRACSQRLSSVELIPILSYVAQRGRCRACGSLIGRGIPFREAVSGFGLALPWAVFGCSRPVLAFGAGAGIVLGFWGLRALVQKV